MLIPTYTVRPTKKYRRYLRPKPHYPDLLYNMSAISVLQQQMSACLDEVALWMRSNRLQLNTAKTEVLWCATSRRKHQIPQALVRVGEDLITPAASVRDLGIYLDSDTSMRSHVSKTVSNCFAALRRIRSIRCCVPRQAVLSLVVSLVLSRVTTRLRQCHTRRSTGIPDRLQSVLNAAARLV